MFDFFWVAWVFGILCCIAYVMYIRRQNEYQSKEGKKERELDDLNRQIFYLEESLKQCSAAPLLTKKLQALKKEVVRRIRDEEKK